MATDSHSLLLQRKTKVCFSIAAYSKDLISTLHHTSNVPIAPGLTNHELSTIESTFSFTFPPDLRSILREGLPIGVGFPNWRSSSLQQLQILINLPILGLLKQISRQNFWYKNWGKKPHNSDDAIEIGKQFLSPDRVPLLIPVYRNCYVPASPCVAGNPVFYVTGSEIRLWSYDVVGFFQQTEFREGEIRLRPVMRLGQFLSAPLWAATESRTIEFWSELVDDCDGDGRRRWWGESGSELRGFLEGVRVKLRNGGWDEKDVDEMMMMMEINGGDEKVVSECCGEWDRELAGRLLRAGWSRGDVMESLGCLTMEEDCRGEIENECGGDSLFDFEYNRYSCVGDGEMDRVKVEV